MTPDTPEEFRCNTDNIEGTSTLYAPRAVAWGFRLGGQDFRQLYTIFAWRPFSLRILQNSENSGGATAPPAPPQATALAPLDYRIVKTLYIKIVSLLTCRLTSFSLDLLRPEVF